MELKNSNIIFVRRSKKRNQLLDLGVDDMVKKDNFVPVIN
jgi:hypothetical protein